MSKKKYLFDPSSNALERNDYRASEYIIPKTDLHFDLDETKTVVSSKLSIKRNPDLNDIGGPLILDGENLKLMSVKIDGKELDKQDYSVTDKNLIIKRPPVWDFTLEIQNEVNPSANTSLEGLYKSGDILSTQCEAQGFRHITYFLDRPDVLSIFTTKITADKEKHPIILSNGNGDPAQTIDLGDGRHEITWEDPHPKPAYLFALVGGQLNTIEDSFTTMNGRDVTLRIFVQDGYEDKVSWAMESVKRSMKWDEDTYGREYDLDVFHILATDKFNMGAMENKGLNIFNVSLLIGDPDISTDSDLINIEAVIGHEYFHNWSGNRVTVRDWFELTLKEGLTVLRDRQFTSDMHSKANKLIEDANMLKAVQFVEDGGPTSHPIRPDFVEEFNNIYTGTIYEKGSHVLGMLRTIVGEDTWRIATDDYFAKFDGKAVTCDDFVDTVEQASNVDLTQFRRWYKQSGTPEITYDGDYDASSKTYTLTLTQNTPSTHDQKDKENLFIPVSVGLIDKNGHDVDLGGGRAIKPRYLTKTLHLTEKTQSFIFKNIENDVVPSILRNFSAPVKLKTQAPESELFFRMVNDSDSYNRNEAATELKIRAALDMIKSYQAGQDMVLNQELINAFSNSLDTALDGDKDFAAGILSLPMQSVLAQEMDIIDPDAIDAATKAMKQQLLIALKAKFETIYTKTEAPKGQDYEVTNDQVGRRALHNLSLAYLMADKNPEAIKTAKEQFNNASNMTERLSALSCLSQIDCPEAEEALNTFLTKYRGNNNVVDKWLRLQGATPHGDPLARIKDIMTKESHIENKDDRVFNIENPNKLRALIGSFTMANSVNFHNKNGSGYKFLGDIIIQLNTMNPQIGAGMCRPLMQLSRYDDERRGLMLDQLKRIKQTPDLHPGINELISKAINVAEELEKNKAKISTKNDIPAKKASGM